MSRSSSPFLSALALLLAGCGSTHETTGSGGGGGSGGGAPHVCTPGATAPCYSGAPGTEGIGPCHGGTRTCNADGTAWSACSGEVVPTAEDCKNAFDDDCNGKVNDGCPCMFGEMMSCYSGAAGTMGVGICHAGMQICDGESFGPCIGEQTPLPEDCSTTADESCNGETLDADAGCVCAPGSTQACYTGPAGTENVGICHGGVATCDASGKAWGPCDGEQTPLPEDCAQPADEDCSGHACAEPFWAMLIGGPGDQTPAAVAFDAMGDVFVLGSFDGTLQTGSISLVNAGTKDTFLIKLDPAGNPLWGQRFGGDTTANVTPTGLAVDSAGNVIMTLGTWGTIDFGGGAEPAAVDGYDDTFAVKLAPDGTFLWSRRLGGAQEQLINGVAMDAAGEVYITGTYYPAIDFGSGAVSCGASSCPFVARLDGATGNVVWGKGITSTKYQNKGTAVAVDPTGNLVVLGVVEGSVDLGGGPLDTGYPVYPSQLYLGKLTNQGTHVWSTFFGADAVTQGGNLALDAQGGIAVAGTFAQTMTLGGSYLTSGPLGNIFLARFDSTGTAQWATSYSEQFSQELGGLGVGASGEMVLSLSSLETVDFGGGGLTSAGSYDMFVGKYLAPHTYSWERQYGDNKRQDAGPVAVGAGGAIVVTGHVAGTIDFGKGTLTANAGDVVVAKLAP